jgi:uncharacterized protein YcnI
MRRLAALAAAALLAAGAAPAVAHVDVLPDHVAQGTALEFTVRVPTERALPTTGVRIDFPTQITVYSFAAPPPGWTLRPLLGPDKRYSGVVYSGGRIPVGQYEDFRMLGTPFESGSALWKTRQTYADGQVKPWTGPPEKPGATTQENGPTSPGPAAVVTIAEPGQAVGATGAGATHADDSGAAIWLGVIAIAISAMALLALGFLWSTRPARLPGGDEGT